MKLEIKLTMLELQPRWEISERLRELSLTWHGCYENLLQELRLECCCRSEMIFKITVNSSVSIFTAKSMFKLETNDELKGSGRMAELRLKLWKNS